MKTEPWEHQLKALDYLMIRDNAALYTDMGTGKTKVMIDLIVNRGFNTVLVVCPKKVCDVWEYEVCVHSNLSKNCVYNVSSMSTVDKATFVKEVLYKRNKAEPAIIICNYDSVWIEPFSKVLLHKKVGIEAVICDESHRIKSPSSKCSRYLAKIGKQANFRYLMTGTPLAENPMDVYAQYRFLDPSIFGTNYADFKAQYENVDIQRTMKVGYTVLDSKTPYLNLDTLQEKMFSCAFKVDSTVKLPDTTSLTYEFMLNKKACKQYDDLLKEGVLEFDEGFVEVTNVLARITREQQLTSGFAVVEDYDFTGTKTIVDVDDSRKVALEELLEGIPQDESVVVFAKFTHDLRVIREVAKKTGRGYSEVSGREYSIGEWKEGKTRVLGVQYRAGSEGINLTKARYCIYYSLNHSLMLYEQSLKRTHRPGQTRPVTYYHMVAKAGKIKTIDEKIMQALKNKKDIVKCIMEKAPY